MCNLQSAVCTRISYQSFSVRATVAKQNSVKFSKSKCWIQNSSGNLCGTDLLVGKLYQLDCKPVYAEHTSLALKQHSDLDLWHQTLGHLNAQHFKEAIQKKFVNSLKIQKIAKLFSVKGVLKARCTNNLSSQWERYAQPESSS